MLLPSLRTLLIVHVVILGQVLFHLVMTVSGPPGPLWADVTEVVGLLESVAIVVGLALLFRERRAAAGGEWVQAALVLASIDLLLALMLAWRYHFSQLSQSSLWLESVLPILVGGAATLCLWLSLTPLADQEREPTVGMTTAVLPLLGLRSAMWLARSLVSQRLYDAYGMDQARSYLHVFSYVSVAMSLTINILFVVLLLRLVRRAGAGDFAAAANAPAPAVGGMGRDVLVGAIWLGVGLTVTIASFAASHGGSGRFVVAYGAVIVGIARIVRGLTRRS